MLANHAESRDGLLYISGGTWDTLNVQAPMEGGPPNAVAVFQGVVVARLTMHATEAPSDHTFRLVVMDEDGQELAAAEGGFHVEKIMGTPPEWGQGSNLIIGLTGLPLPRFGQYSLHLLVDARHLGERPFRVLKLY
jgi:hypothetical protein